MNSNIQIRKVRNIAFTERGFEVMIMDYRGYGKSTGDRSHASLLSDADRLYEFALDYVPEDRLTVFGRFIGCSFATHLVGQNNPSRLISETPFYRLEDVAKRVPIYLQNLLLRFNFNNYESLKNATCPIYIFHGTNDQVMPLESGAKLHETLDPDQSKMIIIEKGCHNNLARFDTYWSTIEEVWSDE